MEFNAKFKINPVKLIMSSRGLEKMGAIQNFVDSECIRLMTKYTPFQTGTLEKSANIHTDIGSGKIVQATPYARYLYYGEVFGPNYPIRNGRISFNESDGPIEGWVSGKKKYPTGRPITYNKATHPLAGKLWFERMKTDHANDILEGAKKIAGGKK